MVSVILSAALATREGWQQIWRSLIIMASTSP